ncbi:hypothetical protein EDC04DRAFT_2726603 [Pisolithus marmoratus]|nr:hypothetical protein EDC04DRAFT_2726603 [Pisolithus marmoratus]
MAVGHKHVDALFWARDASIKPSSFIAGSHFVLPAACLCICIHLERLASFSQMSMFVVKGRRIMVVSAIFAAGETHLLTFRLPGFSLGSLTCMKGLAVDQRPLRLFYRSF